VKTDAGGLSMTVGSDLLTANDALEGAKFANTSSSASKVQ